MSNDSYEDICWLCGDTPCEWLRWGEDIKKKGLEYKASNGESIPNSKIRKCLYR